MSRRCGAAESVRQLEAGAAVGQPGLDGGRGFAVANQQVQPVEATHPHQRGTGELAGVRDDDALLAWRANSASARWWSMKPVTASTAEIEMMACFTAKLETNSMAEAPKAAPLSPCSSPPAM